MFGIEYLNNSTSKRSCVHSAKTKEEAEKVFFNTNCHRENGCKIQSINEITSDKCIVLYQSGREIVDTERKTFKTKMRNGEFIVEIDNILSYGTVEFKEEDLHCNGNELEVMVCIHDGKPNWLY